MILMLSKNQQNCCQRSMINLDEDKLQISKVEKHIRLISRLRPRLNKISFLILKGNSS